MAPQRSLAALAVLVCVAAGAGCGEGEAQPIDAPAGVSNEPPRLETTIYFLTDGGRAAIGVRRSIARKSPFAREALGALLAGPTSDERTRGIMTAIPAGTVLRALQISDEGQAVVELSELPANAAAPDRVRVITQITRTLVGLSGIERVRLRASGEPWGLWWMSGGTADIAYGYDTLVGFSRICSSRPGTEAVEGDCFSALP
jgi:hypothetical protein